MCQMILTQFFSHLFPMYAKVPIVRADIWKYFTLAFPGVNSKPVSTDGTDLSGSVSKGSSVSVPPTPRSEGEILQSANLKSFAFSDLKMATRNFRPDSVLGEGGFGSVFKGWIDEGSYTATKPGTGVVVAVKRLNQDGFQGHREWLVSGSFFSLDSRASHVVYAKGPKWQCKSQILACYNTKCCNLAILLQF